MASGTPIDGAAYPVMPGSSICGKGEGSWICGSAPTPPSGCDWIGGSDADPAPVDEVVYGS